MITGELADHVLHLMQEGTPFVVATVIRASRPTSVRPGFSAVVLADGTMTGFVGGTCAESSVRLYSLRALETGEPVLLRIVPGDGDSPAAPAFPAVPASHAAPASPAVAALRGTFADAVVEHNPCLSGGALEIFLEPHLPAARLVVVGSSPIADALSRVSAAAGYDVVHEHDPSAGDAAVIVASHGSEEERVLADALAAGVPYVALVASAARGEAVRAALDVPEELRAQLHTPAGLDIGARTPDEIAISILAELIAEHRSYPVHVPDRGARAAGAVVATAAAVDPVCGMAVAVSDATPHLDVADERVYFCSTGCRDAYAREHAAH